MKKSGTERLCYCSVNVLRMIRTILPWFFFINTYSPQLICSRFLLSEHFCLHISQILPLPRPPRPSILLNLNKGQFLPLVFLDLSALSETLGARHSPPPHLPLANSPRVPGLQDCLFWFPSKVTDDLPHSPFTVLVPSWTLSRRRCMRSDLSKGTEEGCARVEWLNALAGGMCLGKFPPLFITSKKKIITGEGHNLSRRLNKTKRCGAEQLAIASHAK